MTTQQQNTELTPCWYVKDFADGWIKFYDVDCAISEAKETGALMIYSHDASEPRPAKAVQGDIESVLTKYEKEIVANTPMGGENKRLGASTYNWRKHVLAEIRAMVTAALTPESEGIAGKGENAEALKRLKKIEEYFGLDPVDYKNVGEDFEYIESTLTRPKEIDVEQLKREAVIAQAGDKTFTDEAAYGVSVAIDHLAASGYLSAPQVGVPDGAVQMMARDQARMRQAGTALAEAALRVIRDYDGTHRLALAVAEWSRAIADEGDRAEAQSQATQNEGATPPQT